MSLIDVIVKLIARRWPPSSGEEEPAKAEPAESPVPAESPAPAGEPEPPIKHWKLDMIPRVIGPGARIEHSGGGGNMACGSVRLEWVSRQTDGEGKPLRVRTPESHTETMPKRAFTAAGERYRSLHELVYRWEDTYSPWAGDIYGRDVLAVAESFPCFDSSDYLYENRCFRWFFLCKDGKLTCVYHTDGTDTVTVTEDVQDLEELCWKKMNDRGCFD